MKKETRLQRMNNIDNLAHDLYECIDELDVYGKAIIEYDVVAEKLYELGYRKV